MEIELEAKALITKQEYENIINKYNIIKTVTQVNYYFETEDSYFKNNFSALRVRIKDDTYELTLKKRATKGSIEHNFKIGKEEFDILMTNRIIPSQIQKIVNADLTLTKLDIIETKRSTFSFEEHIVEIDQTNFGMKIDYEIEIESDSIRLATKTMQHLLDENSIEFRISMPKIARLNNYKNEQ